MSRPRLVVAVILLLVGLLWVGQGIGLIGGSAMTGAPIWAVIGTALVVAAVVVVATGRRGSAPAG